MKQRNLIIALALNLIFFLSACGDLPALNLYDHSSDEQTVKLANEITAYIVEKGFGHKVIVHDTSSTDTILDPYAFFQVGSYAGNFTDLTDSNKVELVRTKLYYVDSTVLELSPDLMHFLTNVNYDTADLENSLAFLEEHNSNLEAARLHFLINNQSKWMKWMPKWVYNNVKAAYKREGEKHPLWNEF